MSLAAITTAVTGYRNQMARAIAERYQLDVDELVAFVESLGIPKQKAKVGNRGETAEVAALQSMAPGQPGIVVRLHPNGFEEEEPDERTLCAGEGPWSTSKAGRVL